MSIKYCVTITLRNPVTNYVQSNYVEYQDIKNLNSFLFDHICNSKTTFEIVGLYFEVVTY